MASFDFTPGRDYVYRMQQAIATTKRTIAVLSPAYLGSEFGGAEWRAAFAKDPSGERGLLIPIMVKPCDAPGLLATRIHVDLVGATEEQARSTLLAAVGGDQPHPTAAPYPGESRAVGRTGRGGLRPRFPGSNPAKPNRRVLVGTLGAAVLGLAVALGLAMFPETMRHIYGGPSPSSPPPSHAGPLVPTKPASGAAVHNDGSIAMRSDSMADIDREPERNENYDLRVSPSGESLLVLNRAGIVRLPGPKRAMVPGACDGMRVQYGPIALTDLQVGMQLCVQTSAGRSAMLEIITPDSSDGRVVAYSFLVWEA